VTSNYRRILTMVIEDGVRKGVYSLEDEDLDNISLEKLIQTISKNVTDEIHDWFSLGESK